MNGLDHPMVEDYLSRLDRASGGLPAEARSELRADITEHLASGLGDDPSDADVRNLLQQLGSPEQIAAAALADAEPVVAAPLPPPGAPPAEPPPGPPPMPASQFGFPTTPPTPVGAAAGVWGPVEIIAVVGLTAGMFVVPVVGPVVGIVMAWISPRWTRREKTIATVLAALPLIAVVVLAAGLFAVSSGSSSGSSSQPAPTVSAVPLSSPTGSVTPLSSPTGSVTPLSSPTGSVTPLPSPTGSVTPLPSRTGSALPTGATP